MNHIIDDESGLGLIEIVVSMFLIALIAIAFLPFLINSYGTTRTNTTLATATQLLDQQFDQLRQLSTRNCAGLTTFKNRADTTLDRVVDTERNVTLTVSRTFACPSNAAQTGSEKMTISILDSTSGRVVTSASTIVFVEP
ncbi:Tfp pilus assembly protein PilV [Microbacteriaceae bacterium SG_E_30_P1]|uniref:Tfp pilus assembly protein PilV n=1 Tax=Antiquaquibacter oligotrophicus TaxID=2880260 RepID=A0ABT6KJ11_9MICO|nr:hypothetical protein [Antiquaquibacter oligotrophicus]MDH6179893.1 Tfp pilus assembly protein PilV [Antiquaquibacter oligotrophicus]UDF14346.1 hypothetical protein LH407_05650 [Antiquaquibacter oligotrophicus]